MKEELKNLWNKYESWCYENYGDELKLFNESVSNKKLDELMNIVGYLDDDFKKLYKIHNGEASGYGMFFGFTFLSIDKIIDEIKFMIPDNSYSGTSHPEKCINIEYYNKGWLPIAADGSGNFIGIDYEPDVNGKTGQIINFGRDERNKYVLSQNLREFLEILIEEMKKGNIIYSNEGVQLISPNGYKYNHLTDFMINLKYNN
ncbi:MAG: SMI1/KNR4 family protein [Romboutsia sp.]|nr:SMI1/KNR4 family protein [Romboutsia sp.]